MFVISMKTNGKKLLLGVLLALIAAGGFFLFRGGSAGVPASAGIQSREAATNEQRIAFLESFGWVVEGEACEVVEVAVPMEFGDVYAVYNRIQTEQGFSLEEYQGKRVRRYSYSVLNYPGHPEHVRANLLIYQQEIIGGDICSLELDGFQHGFRMNTDQ